MFSVYVSMVLTVVCVCVCVCVCVRASVRAGTCVAYAFTLALQEDVDAKFGIAVNPEALVEKT